MAKPKAIRDNLSRYLCSIMWVQEWGIQDPLKPSPIISNKAYPPNTFTELPIEQLEILPSDFTGGYRPNKLTCRAKFPFRITYIFDRNIYQSFKNIPIDQIENLLFKASQLILLFANRIDEDIVKVDIPQQQNPFIVRAADDISSDKSGANAWAITAKIDIDIEFLSSADEFTTLDYIDIQPPSFTLPDGGNTIDLDINNFDLKELRIEVNRSKLPQVLPNDDTTFKLDEIIILKEENI